MKVTREKTENSQAYLTVEMEPADMETSMEGSYRRLSQKANIPGFRRGKAPRAVVERYLGKARLLEEAIDHMLPQAYEQALKEQSLNPVAQPELEITGTDPLVFKAVVPLQPLIELGDYRSIRMTPDTVDIKEENISAVLEELRHQHATWEPVDRALDYNDMAVMDIDGRAGDRPLIKKVAAQYQVLKDSISPAPGFVGQITGLKKDEEKEFTLTFPADFPSKDVAGKEASFKVKLH
ncbi:MAG: trigger factor, partial [Chloroflexi bacterium RBG_16_56_11]